MSCGQMWLSDKVQVFIQNHSLFLGETTPGQSNSMVFFFFMFLQCRPKQAAKSQPNQTKIWSPLESPGVKAP